MFPNLENEQVLILKSYNNDFDRGDIVVIKIQGRTYIKRIVGLPNEKLQIIDGDVYINGVKYEEDYAYSTTVYGIAKEEVSIPDDCYFVMGDNRDDSKDSRSFGVVKTSDIVGKAEVRVFPFWEIERIDK